MRLNILLAAAGVLLGVVPSVASAGQAQAQPSTSIPSPVGEERYTIQPGDELEFRVFNLPELTQTLVVRPDGNINLMFVNDVRAAGKTVAALTTELEKAYSAHFRSPQLSISVKSFSGRNVYVGGEVQQPGMIAGSMPMSVLGAVFRAGGFRETADLRSVVVMRDTGGGTPERIEVNAEAVMNGSQQDPPVRPKDVIFVRKSTLNVYVGGEVDRPGLVVVMGRSTLAAAVMQAGPIRSSARLGEVILLRNENGRAGVHKFNLKAILTKGAPDPPLQPFDVVFLPKSRITKVNDFVEQYIRQILPVNFGFSYLLGAQVF